MKHTQSFQRFACALLLLAFAAQGTEGYFWGLLDDGRAMGLKLSEEYGSAVARIHVEGTAGVGIYAPSSTNRHSLVFTNDMRSGADRWPFTGLVFERGKLPQSAVGRLFQHGLINTPVFSLARVAQVAKFSRKGGVHVAGRGGGKTFSASWPDFLPTNPLHRDVTKLLSAGASQHGDHFTQGSLGLAWEGLKDGGGSWNWEGALDMDGVIWLGTNIVSLHQTRYEYTGGAHGNTEPVGRNFVLLNGKARELALKDLFRADAKWLEALSAACLRELRRQQASFVLNGDIKGFKAGQLQSFNVDRRGLMILFAPYAVGPYAEGMFSVFLPWSELEPLLDPNGPVSLLRRQ